MPSPKTPPTNAGVSLPLPPTYKRALFVSTVQAQIATVQQNPLYATTPAVQAAATGLGTAVAALGGTLTSHANAVALVSSLEGQRAVQISDVLRLHGGMVAVLNVASNGDAQAALAWAGKVKAHAPITPTTAAPVARWPGRYKNIPGEVLVSCKADPQGKFYLFQTGADPAHPETWPAPLNVGHVQKGPD